ncbi:MAG: hypothetical protein K2G47_09045 [Muribaculum sp.]|nr:hypothetical protein [Muribaculum sp.]
MQYKSAQINISTEAVAKEIYATAALRNILTPDSAPSPTLLTPDNRRALIPVIRSSFLRVALAAVGNIESIHPGEDDDTIMPITIKLRAGTTDDTIKAARHAIETAVASATLSTCYAGIDPGAASEFEIHLSRDIATIRDLLPSTIAIPRLTPSN